MEYANQGNLSEYLKEHFKSLQWDRKIEMALDITAGLKCLHSEDIIHKDLVMCFDFDYSILLIPLISYFFYSMRKTYWSKMVN